MAGRFHAIDSRWRAPQVRAGRPPAWAVSARAGVRCVPRGARARAARPSPTARPPSSARRSARVARARRARRASALRPPRPLARPRAPAHARPCVRPVRRPHPARLPAHPPAYPPARVRRHARSRTRRPPARAPTPRPPARGVAGQWIRPGSALDRPWVRPGSALSGIGPWPSSGRPQIRRKSSLGPDTANFCVKPLARALLARRTERSSRRILSPRSARACSRAARRVFRWPSVGPCRGRLAPDSLAAAARHPEGFVEPSSRRGGPHSTSRFRGSIALIGWRAKTSV